MSERRAEAVAYAVAACIIVVLGAILRTPVLNWICGPGIVIAVVALLPPVLMRSADGEDRDASR